jgi:hypothetical protein
LRRRVGRQDLLESGAPFREGGRASAFRWRVYENYQLITPESRTGYFRAAGTEIGDAYEPISDVPYLFLEFARLRKQRDHGDAMARWIGKYGLLGLQRYERSVPITLQKNFRTSYSTAGAYPASEYSDQGGPDETLSGFWEEVRHANTALTHWEAALSADEDQLEQALLRRWHSHPGEKLPYLESMRSTYAERALKAGVSYTDILIHDATFHALKSVQEVLQAFAYPYLAAGAPRRSQVPDHLYSPDGLAATWWSRNLLGAMYLQMYWLMTSSGDLARCKYCGRIISYAPPIPVGEEHKARKPRKDKEFCDSRCRQNFHYHNRIKRKRANWSTARDI